MKRILLITLILLIFSVSSCRSIDLYDDIIDRVVEITGILF